MSFRPGQRVRVVAAPTMPKDAKPPFRVGDIVTVLRVTPAGSVLTDAHPGYFRLERFAPE